MLAGHGTVSMSHEAASHQQEALRRYQLTELAVESSDWSTLTLLKSSIPVQVFFSPLAKFSLSCFPGGHVK